MMNNICVGKRKIQLGFKILLILVSIVLFLSMYFGVFDKISFVDEQENWTAGWFISQGLIPYKDFFFHHAPIPFYLSSLVIPFLNDNYILFRVEMFLYTLIVLIPLFFLLNKKMRIIIFPILLLYSFSIPYLHLHMMLAETFSSLSILATTFLVVDTYVHKKKNILFTYFYLLTITSIALWSTVVYIVPACILLFTFIYLQKDKIFGLEKKLLILYSFISLFILFVIPLYFVLVGSFKEFIWSVFTYNSKYYYHLRLANGDMEQKYGVLFRLINQSFLYSKTQLVILIQALIILIKTLIGYFLYFIKNLSFINPFEYGKTMLVSFIETISPPPTAAFLVFISISLYIIKKTFKVFFLFVFIAISLRMRDNEIFHLAPYYIFLITSLSIVIKMTYEKVNTRALFYFVFIYCIFGIGLINTYIRLYKDAGNFYPKETYEFSIKVRNSLHKNPNLFVLGGNTIYYLFLFAKPSQTLMYYYPWFDSVSEMKSSVYQSIDKAIPEIIIMEDVVNGDIPPNYFAKDIASLVLSKYKNVNPTIYKNK